VASVPLKANGGWVSVSLGVEDFKPTDPKGAQPLKDWSTLTELAISGHATIVKDGVKTSLPSVAWKNAKEVRLRAVKWDAGSRDGQGGPAPVKELTEAERTKIFNDSIKKSLEQEARDR
jgi:hypothetical protein